MGIRLQCWIKLSLCIALVSEDSFAWMTNLLVVASPHSLKQCYFCGTKEVPLRHFRPFWNSLFGYIFHSASYLSLINWFMLPYIPDSRVLILIGSCHHASHTVHLARFLVCLFGSCTWVNSNFPLQTGYTDRQKFLEGLHEAANQNDAAATLVWQVYAWPIEVQDSYNFDWSQPGNEALRTQIQLMKERVLLHWLLQYH